MATIKTEPSTNQLPFGIVVLAGLFGLATFIGAVALLIAAIGGAGPFLLLEGLFILCVCGACACGLNRLDPRAWYLLLAIQALALLLTLYSLSQDGDWGLALVKALPPLVVLYYLFRPHVKRAFRQQSEGHQWGVPSFLKPHRP